MVELCSRTNHRVLCRVKHQAGRKDLKVCEQSSTRGAPTHTRTHAHTHSPHTHTHSHTHTHTHTSTGGEAAFIPGPDPARSQRERERERERERDRSREDTQKSDRQMETPQRDTQRCEKHLYVCHVCHQELTRRPPRCERFTPRGAASPRSRNAAARARAPGERDATIRVITRLRAAQEYLTTPNHRRMNRKLRRKTTFCSRSQAGLT